MKFQYDYTILELINNAIRTVKAAPLVLGATSSGSGGPIGGYVGFLPQTKVSYDPDELAMSGFMESGAYNEELGIIVSGSLIDNLNHIRWRLENLEAGSGGGGASYFLDLLDTPDTYSGYAGYVVSVNPTETALEFTIPSGGSGVPGGSDTQVQYNDGGAFAGDTEFNFDDVAKALGLGDPSKFPFAFGKMFWTVGDGDSPAFIGVAYGADKAPFLTFAKADGTAASPANVKENQTVGIIRGRGYDGTLWTDTRAAIYLIADKDWSSGDTPTRIEFWTTPDGSATPALVATIRSDGNIDIASGKEYRVDGAQHAHNMSNITDIPALSSGTWTPTGTTGTNVASVTTYLMNYIRVGNQVFFNGLVSIDTTTTGAFTCYLTVPIASDFNASTDANGNGTQPGAGGGNNIISIREDQTNNRLQLDGYTYSAGEVYYRLAGGYIIK